MRQELYRVLLQANPQKVTPDLHRRAESAGRANPAGGRQGRERTVTDEESDKLPPSLEESVPAELFKAEVRAIAARDGRRAANDHPAPDETQMGQLLQQRKPDI